jgi:hypothetical protein
MLAGKAINVGKGKKVMILLTLSGRRCVRGGGSRPIEIDEKCTTYLRAVGFGPGMPTFSLKCIESKKLQRSASCGQQKSSTVVRFGNPKMRRDKVVKKNATQHGNKGNSSKNVHSM